jgi:hypothetical protein
MKTLREFMSENAWNQLGQKKPNKYLPSPAKGSVHKHDKKFDEGDFVKPHAGPHAGEIHRVTSSRKGDVNMVRVGPGVGKYDSITVRAKHEHLSPASDSEAGEAKERIRKQHERMFGSD